ncbi:MAG: hypothetical protein ACRCXX_02035 [Cetobacterium sp.]|uniref:hypothetical protein n=1 Tax=Cetobacterium sp. TaxID=2071632 RepID=UPI003F3395BF
MYSGKKNGLYVKRDRRRRDGLPYFKIMGNPKFYSYVVFMELYTTLMDSIRDKFIDCIPPEVKISENLTKVHNSNHKGKKEYLDAKTSLRNSLIIAQTSDNLDKIEILDKRDALYFVDPILIDSDFISEDNSFRIPMYKVTDDGRKLVKKLATVELINTLTDAIHKAIRRA